MPTQPLISVCITTYNHEKFLAQALDSVLMQQGDFVLEVLVGEDGSSDNTAAIVRDYATRHPDTIRAFYHDPNDKLFINGRQTGRKNFLNNLAQTKGEYIALLDGDDYWTDSQKLQKQLDILQQHPQLSACCHAAIYVDAENKAQKGFMGHHDVDGAFRDFSLRDVLRKNPVPTLSVMFRNPRMQEYPSLYLKTDMADWPTHILTARRGDIRYSNEKMAAYRVHAGGIWAGFRDNLEKTLLSEMAVWRILIEEPIFAAQREYLTQLISAQHIKLIKAALREHDYHKAWRYWREQGKYHIGLAWRIARKQMRHALLPKHGARHER
ncbi:MAG: glycosyltransferase [Cellvibrionales bacterium]|nr:glycosyltransferase [Cellvibrionales bacterium]